MDPAGLYALFDELRVMLLKEVIGQEKVKERLIRSVQEQRISHAQLFSGPEGSGKLSLAIAYAQYISCRQRTDTDSCGECPSCRKYTKLIHPDLHFVFPIFKPKNNQRPFTDDFLKQWREFVLATPYFNLNQWLSFLNVENAQGTIYAHESESILRKLNIKSFESEYKVMIIWLPEKMQEECANKLLKMIEEPPNKTLFLLVTEDEEAIIGTIRSRTQLIKIPPIELTALQQAFLSREGLEPDTVAEMVHLSNGNYLKALEYLDMGEDKKFFFDSIRSMMRLAYSRKIVELMELAEELAGIGREKQKDFFIYALHLMREYFMMNFKKPALTYLYKEEQDWGKDFSPFINERNIIPLARVFEEGHLHISRNGNSKIIFADVALTIVRLIRR